MNLEKKIAIIILQIALIPWALAGIIAYLSAQEQINAKTYTNLAAFADLQKNWLQDAIQNKLDTLSLFSNDPELVALFHDYRAQPTLLAEKKVQEYLAGELGTITSIQKVFLVTPTGTVAASTDKTLIGKNVNAEEYFKLGLHANDASTLKKDAAGVLSQYLAGPIRVRGVTEGVVVAVSDAHEILSIAKQYEGLGNTGETVLVKRVDGGDALFLTPTRFDPSAALTRTVSASQVNVPAPHAVAGEELIFTNAVDYRGVKIFAATRYISSVGWGIVAKIDQSEALAPVRRLGELFALIILVAGIFVVFISISMSRSITRPINQLTLFVRKVAEGGNLQQSVVVTSKDEVGTLGAAFNNMILRLREAYTTLEKKVAERTSELAEKTADARNSEAAAMNIASDLKDEEEKLAEEKMKAEELANDLIKFKLALDNASDQVTITDPEGMVIYANAAVVKIAGYSPEEVVGKRAGALWKLPMSREYYAQLWHTIRDEKKPFIGEIQNRRKNGEVYTAMFTASPVLDENGTIIFYVSLERDITKEKEVDTAKSEFISLASHQMRAPLTAINWYSEMLTEGDAGKLTKKQQEYFGAIHTAGQQMNEIIKSFLHILRLETGTLTMSPIPVNLEEVIRATLKESQLEIGKKKLHVVEQYQASLPMLTVDVELIRVILQNLISNAVKYTPKEGEMAIFLKTVARGEIVAGKTAEQDAVLVSVRDTGIGIPQADRDKIFTKFFRSGIAKQWDPNGNGIGLYMSNKMAEAIGGAIWFESEEGKGTTFYVFLPLQAAKS